MFSPKVACIRNDIGLFQCNLYTLLGRGLILLHKVYAVHDGLIYHGLTFKAVKMMEVDVIKYSMLGSQSRPFKGILI